MNRTFLKIGPATFLTAILLCGLVVQTEAAITGISGTDVGGVVEFNLTARCDFISTPDGNSVLIWGYSDDGNPMERAQYPGPTMIVNEGDVVRVNLTNNITDETGALIGVNTSIMFPGHNASSSGGTSGLLTQEAAPGGTVTYEFTATHPGTYIYHSGTNAQLQVELGLQGALIVRPSMGLDHAYDTADSQFDREYLFYLTEMDPTPHDLVEFGQFDAIDNNSYWPVYWFINGRAAPDTLFPDNIMWLPTQPYGSLVRMLPGERVLMRVVTGGRDLHPFHHHGNHARVIAKDGRLQSSPGSTDADLSFEVFTIQAVPMETVDAIFTWSDFGMGWDIYGDPTDPAHAHTCVDGGDGFDATTHEWCENHGKPFPVILPENQDLTFGGFWSGSQYLGAAGGLPPGEGGLNPNAGFFFMWHSHTEKELVNFDIFPGGMLTMMVVEPPGTVIP